MNKSKEEKGEDNLFVFERQKKQGVVYALRLLSIAKRTEFNIKSKLAEKGYPEEVRIAIVDELKVKGYKLARRTIVKYRKELKIGSSSTRKFS